MSPDGNKLAFETYRAGQWQLYVMNADGSNQTPLSIPVNAFAPVWSPDGAKIAFTGYDSAGHANVYVINADGTGLDNLTNDATGTSYFPAWSPDGAKIMFLSIRDEVQQSIYVMDADGTDVTRLTYYRDDAPVWSPNGTKIAFVSRRNGSAEIYSMDADGSNQTNLTNTGETPPEAPFTGTGFNSTVGQPPSNTMPAWSPDGKSIAFTSDRDGQSEIYVMTADGSIQTALTVASDSYEPRFSPDGAKIAFLTYRDGNQEIYVMDADGTSVVNVTNYASYDAGFSWQPL